MVKKTKFSGMTPPLLRNVVERFKQVIGGLSDLHNISFARSIQPSQEPKGLPMLLVFGDGSLEAYCTVQLLMLTGN